MNLKSFIWFCLPMVIIQPEVSASSKIKLSASSLNYSEPISIDGLFNEWNAPFEGGTKSFSINKMELGFGVENYEIGFVYRQDHFYKFSSRTAELIHNAKNRNELIEGQSYPLKLKANSFAANGIKLGYLFNKDGFEGKVSLSILEGLDVISGGLTGLATSNTNKDYNYQFDVDYFYRKDVLFHREVPGDVKGRGYSLDVVLTKELRPNWTMGLSVEDVLAEIHWDVIPNTQATGSSNNKQYDENGYVQFRPVASGVESYKNHIQILPRKIQLNSDYEWRPNHYVLAQVNDYEVERFIFLGYRFNQTNYAVTGLLNISKQAIQIGYSGEYLEMMFTTDELNLADANLLGLKMNLSIPF